MGPRTSSAEPPGPLVALAGRARRTSDSRLVGLEILGVLTVIGVIAWFPDQLPLSLPGIALSMFGLWGVTDHFRHSGRRSRAVHLPLRVLQFVVAVIGTTAVAAAIYVIAGRLIGTVVS